MHSFLLFFLKEFMRPRYYIDSVRINLSIIASQFQTYIAYSGNGPWPSNFFFPPTCRCSILAVGGVLETCTGNVLLWFQNVCGEPLQCAQLSLSIRLSVFASSLYPSPAVHSGPEALSGWQLLWYLS